MLAYTAPADLDEFLSSTVEWHRCVQRAISTFANHELGLNDPPRGIYRAEGGVKVRGVDVKIKKTVIFAPPGCEEEERAVAEAIKKVVELWRNNGKTIPQSFCERGWAMGDPLSSFYSPHVVELFLGLPEP